MPVPVSSEEALLSLASASGLKSRCGLTIFQPNEYSIALLSSYQTVPIAPVAQLRNGVCVLVHK